MRVLQTKPRKIKQQPTRLSTHSTVLLLFLFLGIVFFIGVAGKSVCVREPPTIVPIKPKLTKLERFLGSRLCATARTPECGQNIHSSGSYIYIHFTFVGTCSVYTFYIFMFICLLRMRPKRTTEPQTKDIAENEHQAPNHFHAQPSE